MGNNNSSKYQFSNDYNISDKFLYTLIEKFIKMIFYYLPQFLKKIITGEDLKKCISFWKMRNLIK